MINYILSARNDDLSIRHQRSPYCHRVAHRHNDLYVNGDAGASIISSYTEYGMTQNRTYRSVNIKGNVASPDIACAIRFMMKITDFCHLES